MNVTVYTSPTCGYCHQAKAFLTQKGIKFRERDVSVDGDAAEYIVQRTGQRGVPVIVIDDQVVIGFNRVRLEQLLAHNGKPVRLHFGLKIADACKIMQKSNSVPIFGAYIGAVSPSSLGEKAGFRKGDIITEVNMRPVHNADDLEKILSGLTSGSKMSTVFIRQQNTLKSDIII